MSEIWIFIIHEKSIPQLLDTATKTGLDALKTGSRKVVHKQLKQVPRWTYQKQNPRQNCKSWLEFVEEIIIPPEKRRSIKRSKTSVLKMEHHKISKLLKNPTVSKFKERKWIEANDLSGGQYSVN